MAFAQTLLRKMLSDAMPEKHYDVYFVAKTRLRDKVNETRLGAHRVVLSAVSDKFDQYAGNTADGSSTDEIIIDDCSAAAVREALEIIYGGDLRESRHSVVLALDIWRFGVRFQVDHLIALARGSCLANLSTDNCLRILDFSVRVDDAQIVDKLQNYASENAHFSHVITSPDFVHLDFNVISSLVRPGKGECAWPEILTFEKVWFDSLIKWLNSRMLIEPAELDNQQLDESNSNASSVEMPVDDVHQKDSDADIEGDIEEDQSMGNKSSDDNTVVRNIKVAKESLILIEKVLQLVDFSRMKTHEVREASKSEIACLSSRFPHELVGVLLERSEQLEASILERNIDLDVIGQKYQQALCEQDAAERKARSAVDKMGKLQIAKVALEKRVEEMRRKKPNTTGSSGPASLNSARRKMSGSSTII